MALEWKQQGFPNTGSLAMSPALHPKLSLASSVVRTWVSTQHDFRWTTLSSFIKVATFQTPFRLSHEYTKTSQVWHVASALTLATHQTLALAAVSYVSRDKNTRAIFPRCLLNNRVTTRTVWISRSCLNGNYPIRRLTYVVFAKLA